MHVYIHTYVILHRRHPVSVSILEHKGHSELSTFPNTMTSSCKSWIQLYIRALENVVNRYTYFVQFLLNKPPFHISWGQPNRPANIYLYLVYFHLFWSVYAKKFVFVTWRTSKAERGRGD